MPTACRSKGEEEPNLCRTAPPRAGLEPQQIMSIQWSDLDPSQWQNEAIPDVDLVRPLRCVRCLCPGKAPGKVYLHGHGKRERSVVVAPALDGDEVELLECWVRRYRCQQCGAVITVLPKGVLPRYLYSAATIVMVVESASNN